MPIVVNSYMCIINRWKFSKEIQNINKESNIDPESKSKITRMKTLVQELNPHWRELKELVMEKVDLKTRDPMREKKEGK